MDGGPVTKISDVYLARKKDARGKFFAFIRFEGVSNEKEPEKRLHGLKIHGNSLIVNITRYQRKENTVKAPFHPHRSHAQPTQDKLKGHGSSTDHRSFADVVKEMNNPLRHNPIHLKTDTPLQEMLTVSSRMKEDGRNASEKYVVVYANDKPFRIGVVEYMDDWSPFKECPFDRTVESDEEAEDEEECDGISDTWEDGMMEELEEKGEFQPEKVVDLKQNTS
ncbi:hypothetical protein L1887_18923 [Cichorium endivia]|nr:hypothetical protein L1887_18923 [Cichorium endivia]